jgi:hypothetical protein
LTPISLARFHKASGNNIKPRRSNSAPKTTNQRSIYVAYQEIDTLKALRKTREGVVFLL